MERLKSTARSVRDWMILRALSVGRLIRSNLPDILAYLSGLSGWALLTYGLMLIIGHPSIPYISAGLLLLGGIGWKLTAALLWDGIYTLWYIENRDNT